MSNAILESGSAYVLSVRSERPIEDCEITPNVYLQLKGGHSGIDNSIRAKLLDSVPYQYIYKWSKSKVSKICSNANCSRGYSFDPLLWSKVALNGPSLACNICLKAGKMPHDVSFCSASCFKEAWRDHTKEHLNLFTKGNSLSLDTSPIEDEEEDEEDGETDVEQLSSTTVIANNRIQQQQYSIKTKSSNEISLFQEISSEAKLSEDWEVVCTEREYIPTAADVGCRLCVEVTAISTSSTSILSDSEKTIDSSPIPSSSVVLAGPIRVYTETVLARPAGPPKRSFAPIAGAGSGLSSSIRFRVISYNILAEMLATKQCYPQCDSWILSWPYRKKLIFMELMEVQADICCLQEVQADLYENDILPTMNELGYDGIFKSKSRDFVGNFGKIDGCATFWKRSKFILTENHGIEFNDLARTDITDMRLEDHEQRRYMNKLKKDNIAQLLVLEAITGQSALTPPRQNSRDRICIVNTHIYSNIQHTDVKLWQSMKLMHEIQSFLLARDLPLLICGDFNSEPGSAVYEYMMKGTVDYNHPELESAKHSRVPVIPTDNRILRHNIELSSVMYTALGREPDFTNYTTNFKGVLDYIFYTPNKIRILAISAVPNENDIKSVCGPGLPCVIYPSDHLMICCDIAMHTNNNNTNINNNPNPNMINSFGFNNNTNNNNNPPLFSNKQYIVNKLKR